RKDIARHRVTAGQGAAAIDRAAISPDGTRAAYSDWSGRVHVVAMDGRENHVLPVEDITGIAWSADGTHVFASKCAKADSDSECVLGQASADGSGQFEPIARVPSGGLRALGVDRLLLTTDDRLSTISLPGGEQHELARFPAPAHLEWAAVTPDARTIAVLDSS